MEKTIVSVVKGEDIRKTTEECIKLLGGIQSIVKEGNTVVVHPAFVTAVRYEHGHSTNPNVVEAVLKICKEAGAKQLIVAEGAGGADTREAFKVCGYTEVARRTGSNLVDLNTAETKEVDIPGAKALPRISIPKVVLESDVFIHVPQLHLLDKSRAEPGYESRKWGSASIKGLIGIPPGRGETGPIDMIRWDPTTGLVLTEWFRPKGEKLRVHRAGLDEALVDLSLLLKPDLTILDATVAGYGRLINGTQVVKPIKMNTLFGSKDPLAVDVAAIKMAGWHISDISYLECGAKRGIYTSDIEKMEIRGSSIEELAKEWSSKVSSISWEHGGLRGWPLSTTLQKP